MRADSQPAPFSSPCDANFVLLRAPLPPEEAKRKKALEERRALREKQVEESLHMWQKDIVPDWKVVHKSSALRKMWWQGIPTSLRASMWENAVGNPLALNKGTYMSSLGTLPDLYFSDNFRTCLARAKRTISANKFPIRILELIEADILRTLPSLHIFHPETGPLYEDLKNMLCAWVVARTDEGLGYVSGIARIAGMLLLQMPPPQAFTLMRNLLERHCLRSFYGGSSTKDDVSQLHSHIGSSLNILQVEAYYR
jgi:hypothetical protein